MLAVTTSQLHILDPDQARPKKESPAQQESNAQSHRHSRAASPRPTSADETRKNRFQLAPERVTELLVAERENVRSRSASPGLIRGHGSRRNIPSLLDEPEESIDFDYGEEIRNIDGFRFVQRNDIAFVMRRRAEEGYGLKDVSRLERKLQLLTLTAAPQCCHCAQPPRRRPHCRNLGVCET